MMPIPLGALVKYGPGRKWKVGSIAWLGERYYFLTRPGEVAMVPAFMLEPDVALMGPTDD